jgi:hypothetical protein
LFTAVSTSKGADKPFLVLQVGFTSALVASAVPVLKLENVIRANITSTIHADLLYTSDNTEHQLSLQVLPVHIIIMLRLNCTPHAAGQCRNGAQS